MKQSPKLNSIQMKIFRNKEAMNFISLKKYLIILAGLSFVLISSSCQGGKTNANGQREGKTVSGPQPVLDSTYYINYIKADARLKDQLDWTKKFYRERDFQLGWFKNNELVPQAKQMLAVIDKSAEEGLDPNDYKIKDFTKMLSDLEAAKSDPTKFADLQKEVDVALSGTYFVWASDYYRGVVIPKENKEIEWDVKRNKIKLHKALMTVLNERESKYSYANFGPLHPEYSRLKTALANYRKLQASGGWPKITANPKLKTGEVSPIVPSLRKRLGLAAADSVFSQEVVDAVKRFQNAQGLKPDGSLGPETVRQLNISVEERTKQIILNMERWRWIPKSFEQDYLLVNIPEYKLHVMEKGKEVMNMNVIVGKTMNSTPIFSDKMETVVLSPYWNVPVSIIQKELAPKLAGNPGYLDRLDMEVVTGKGTPVDPSSVDWGSVNESNWKYVLRRRPGPKNDLGDVKFIFPNTNDIYLHDTPHDELFSQAKRGFSHGCVRVEKPIELAEYLLKNVGYDRNKIENTIAQRKEKHVKLNKVLPVYLVYFTAWADDNGNVHFREDIYGHDKTLAQQYFN